MKHSTIICGFIVAVISVVCCESIVSSSTATFTVQQCKLDVPKPTDVQLSNCHDTICRYSGREQIQAVFNFTISEELDTILETHLDLIIENTIIEQTASLSSCNGVRTICEVLPNIPTRLAIDSQLEIYNYQGPAVLEYSIRDKYNKNKLLACFGVPVKIRYAKMPANIDPKEKLRFMKP